MILDLFNFESICVYAKEKERGSTRKVRRGHERTKRKKKNKPWAEIKQDT